MFYLIIKFEVSVGVEGLKNYFSLGENMQNLQTKSDCLVLALKIASYFTVIIPLIMGISYLIAKTWNHYTITKIGRERDTLYNEWSDLDLNDEEDCNTLLGKVEGVCNCAEQFFSRGANLQAQKCYNVAINILITNYHPVEKETGIRRHDSDVHIAALFIVFESALKTGNADQASVAYQQMMLLLSGRQDQAPSDDLKLFSDIARIVNQNFPEFYKENFREVINSILDKGRELMQLHAMLKPGCIIEELTTLKEELEILASAVGL